MSVCLSLCLSLLPRSVCLSLSPRSVCACLSILLCGWQCWVCVCIDDTSSPLPAVDLVIAVGGDGTLLHVSSLFQGHAPPALGISMGTLGFMMPNLSSDVCGCVVLCMCACVHVGICMCVSLSTSLNLSQPLELSLCTYALRICVPVRAHLWLCSFSAQFKADISKALEGGFSCTQRSRLRYRNLEDEPAPNLKYDHCCLFFCFFRLLSLRICVLVCVRSSVCRCVFVIVSAHVSVYVCIWMVLPLCGVSRAGAASQSVNICVYATHLSA
jgi:ATP-NAD kinase N-terminal domain